MTATGVKMTAEELLRLPDTGKRYELIAGELHEYSLNGGEHGFVSGRVAHTLCGHLERQPEVRGAIFATGTGFRIARNPDTVRAPDVAYVAEARISQARVRGYPDLAPDLVVEVVSPNDTASEIQAKVDEWLRAGVQIVWVLYPSTHSAMVYQADGTARLLHADDSLPGEPVIPGFSCRLGDLF